MANVNINFNNYGITAIVDDTVLNVAAMGDQCKELRDMVRYEIFSATDEIAYTNAADTSVFTSAVGTFTIPNEMIAHIGATNESVQKEISRIGEIMKEQFSASAAE